MNFTGTWDVFRLDPIQNRATSLVKGLKGLLKGSTGKVDGWQDCCFRSPILLYKCPHWPWQVKGLGESSFLEAWTLSFQPWLHLLLARDQGAMLADVQTEENTISCKDVAAHRLVLWFIYGHHLNLRNIQTGSLRVSRDYSIQGRSHSPAEWNH